MPKRNKSGTCSKGWCSNHLLVITPLSKDLYFRKECKVRICPKYNNSLKTFQNSLPIFLKDGKHYTPSFILEDQRKHFSQNDQIVKKSHQTKLKNDEKANNSIQSEILVPKHGRKTNYCAVCRNHYDDYLQHIHDQSHKKFIRANRFNRYITELADSFARTQKIEAKQEPAKNEEQITKQLGGNPRKLVKTESKAQEPIEIP